MRSLLVAEMQEAMGGDNLLKHSYETSALDCLGTPQHAKCSTRLPVQYVGLDFC